MIGILVAIDNVHNTLWSFEGQEKAQHPIGKVQCHTGKAQCPAGKVKLLIESDMRHILMVKGSGHLKEKAKPHWLLSAQRLKTFVQCDKSKPLI